MLIAYYRTNDGRHGYNATTGGDDCNKGLPASTRKDISGKRFGRLLAIQPMEYKNRKLYWKCKCDCGTILTVSYSDLAYGNTKSCGCKNYDRIKEAHRNCITICNDEVHVYLRKMHIETNQYFILDLDQYEKAKEYTWYKRVDLDVIVSDTIRKGERIEYVIFDLHRNSRLIKYLIHKNGNNLDFKKSNIDYEIPNGCNRNDFLKIMSNKQYSNIGWLSNRKQWYVIYDKGKHRKNFSNIEDVIEFNDKNLALESDKGSFLLSKNNELTKEVA